MGDNVTSYNNYRMVQNENARVGCLPGIGIPQQARPRSRPKRPWVSSRSPPHWIQTQQEGETLLSMRSVVICLCEGSVRLSLQGTYFWNWRTYCGYVRGFCVIIADSTVAYCVCEWTDRGHSTETQEMYYHLKEVYGKDIRSRWNVTKWCTEFWGVGVIWKILKEVPTTAHS